MRVDECFSRRIGGVRAPVVITALSVRVACSRNRGRTDAAKPSREEPVEGPV
jgi:hypothetical protein